MSIPEGKNCSDCTNCIAESFQLLKCKRRVHTTIFGVTDFAFCLDERNDEIGECGLFGKFFEQKKSDSENKK